MVDVGNAAAADAFLGDFDGLRLGDGAGMFVRCRRGGQAAGNECGGNGKQGKEAQSHDESLCVLKRTNYMDIVMSGQSD